ncbi:MAG: hypothetical protein J5477_07665, partial [Schwartzia sp.]|nr:hypothetical protein [Schwartzia sp. (in: firmicutes)]
MFKKMFAIMLCALCLAGCGGGSGGGSSSIGGGDPKKEVQAMHDKYMKTIDQVKHESFSMAFSVEDLSQELLDISQKCKSKFEAIGADLEKEKVSKESESYKAALKEYNNIWIKLWDITAKQCKLNIEGASSAEFD